MDYFNPRPREGSDVTLHTFLTAWLISIHAPVKGATEIAYLIPSPIVKFQSTPP